MKRVQKGSTKLKQILHEYHDEWAGQIACLVAYAQDIQDGWDIYASVYSITLVRRGSISIRYMNELIELEAGDLHIYAPHNHTQMLSVSEDYEALLLILDSTFVHHTPLMNHLMNSSVASFHALQIGKLKINVDHVPLIEECLLLIQRHINIPSPLRAQMLTHLCEVLCMDVVYLLDQKDLSSTISSRTHQLYTSFLALVSLHAREIRQLSFYAEALNISTPYLARIVRQCCGHSAMTVINQTICRESITLLRNISLSISQIAYKLHFADVASFSRFFKRVYGMSPSSFRHSLVIR